MPSSSATAIVILCTLMPPVLGQDMIFHKLPLDTATLMRLDIHEDADYLKSSQYALSSRLLAAGISQEEKKSVAWLFSLLDRKYKVNGIVETPKGAYWTLVGKHGKCRLCFPVFKSSTKNSKNANAVFRLFDGVLYSNDREHCPFGFIGTDASEIADFSHPETRKHDEWRTAKVFCTSTGGDNLFVHENGNAAWHQVETNSIFPIGSFEEAVSAFLLFATEGREFSSWTFDGRK